MNKINLKALLWFKISSRYYDRLRWLRINNDSKSFFFSLRDEGFSRDRQIISYCVPMRKSSQPGSITWFLSVRSIRFEGAVCSARRRWAFASVVVVIGAIERIPASGPDPRGWAQRGINKNQGVIAIGRHLSLMTIRFFDLIKWRWRSCHLNAGRGRD